MSFLGGSILHFHPLEQSPLINNSQESIYTRRLLIRGGWSSVGRLSFCLGTLGRPRSTIKIEHLFIGEHLTAFLSIEIPLCRSICNLANTLANESQNQ